MMAFGLRNAAQTMQRLGHAVLHRLEYLFLFMDDIVLRARTLQEHLLQLDEVFRRLNENGLTINLDKCQFAKETMIFLGHQISPAGFAPNPEKVQAILRVKKPTIVKDLESFLAMMNFFRRFLPHAVENQQHLSALIVGNKKNDKSALVWTTGAEIAFEKCKKEMADAAMLAYPKEGAPIYLYVDASDTCVVAVVHQQIDGQLQPLGYYSKKLTPPQLKYSTMTGS